MKSRVRKVLLIRRDNIGDLICSTPLLTALRANYPSVWIGVLANSYNAPILAGNPDVDEVFIYRKAKHRSHGERRSAIWFDTGRLLWRLRREKLDLALCASPGALRFARLLGPGRIIEADRNGSGHEVEITFRMLHELGVRMDPGSLVVRYSFETREAMRATLAHFIIEGRTLALHISARKLRQRWPIERFAELIRHIVARGMIQRVLLFWAPGPADDPMHPGDDEKASLLIEMLRGLPVQPVSTRHLSELVAGLSLADLVICSDGGAMHIAAGLGKPIVCFFGNSDATRWHPWGVPYELLQKPSRDVADISVDEALDALERLLARL